MGKINKPWFVLTEINKLLLQTGCLRVLTVLICRFTSPLTHSYGFFPDHEWTAQNVLKCSSNRNSPDHFIWVKNLLLWLFLFYHVQNKGLLFSFLYRNDIFVFLLSTRAGGLGINLTAADTVGEVWYSNTELKKSAYWCLVFSIHTSLLLLPHRPPTTVFPTLLISCLPASQVM